MKNKIITFIVIALFAGCCGQAGNVYCQNNLLRNQTVVSFIIEHCKYKDNNPIHQSESDSVSYLLQNILIAKKASMNDAGRGLRINALEMFYKNSAGTFEDAVDVLRMGKRRVLCLIALALLEDEHRYMAFLNDARICLANINPNINFVKEYSIIDIIEVIIMMNFDYSQKQMESAIEKLQNNVLLLKAQTEDISGFTKDYMNIINLIENNKKKSQNMVNRKFNIEAFEKNKNESDHWYFTDENGYDIHQYSVTGGYVEYKRKPKDLFEEYYTYYSNGNLKEKKQCFINDGFFKGKGYLYDVVGRLIEEIDYDIPYKYTWEQVFDFAVENEINFYDSHTLIKRYEDKEKGYCWFIVWRAPLKAASNIVLLSGEDGRILEKRVNLWKK